MNGKLDKLDSSEDFYLQLNIFDILVYRFFTRCKQKFQHVGSDMNNCCKWIFKDLKSLHQLKQNLKL